MSRFCSAPWVNISTDVNGSIRPCCRYEQPSRQTKYKMPWMHEGNILDLYNGPQMQELRNAFLRGEEPDECNWCWKEEDAGIKSFRQIYNDVWNLDYDEENPIPQLLDLKLSNVCNLKCRMCGVQASSSIAKELNYQDPYWLSDKIIATDNENTFFKDIVPNIKYIELTGGEPFVSQENKKLIQLISNTEYAKNIIIKLTTNGMFYNPVIMDNMKNFKEVRMIISVDDIEERLEYARGNSDWNKIKSNIKSIIENYSEFDTRIHRTINLFNIYYLNELDKWCNDNNIEITNALLHSPKYLNIQYLPDWAKEKINEKFGNNKKYESILNFMNVETDYMLQEFYDKTKFFDNKRNEDFTEVFKEWSEILLW